MQMDAGLDTGDVLLQQPTPIGPDETAGELFERLAPMGAQLIVQTLAELDQISPRAQNHAAHTLAPLISKDDARIDWALSAQSIHDQVRGFNPWPIAHTALGDQVLKVRASRVVDGAGAAGTVIEAGSRVVVACGSGALELIEVQLPGKRAASGRDLVNSGRIAVGQSLL
jgi:methionyl-tRNA formyltransferase